jgi:predicted anti-sigma-YlaC factor YlaD
MNQHLSAEQIAQWMAGEHPAGAEQHLHQCPECSSEVARLQGTLALFRGAVTEWSEQQDASKVQAAWKVQRASHGFRPMRWALACVALLLLALIPVYHNAAERQRKADIARADAALLEQVDVEISRAVPSTMEPLLKLVAWDSPGDQTTNKKNGVNQ